MARASGNVIYGIVLLFMIIMAVANYKAGSLLGALLWSVLAVAMLVALVKQVVTPAR
jgi:hypothetical protein